MARNAAKPGRAGLSSASCASCLRPCSTAASERCSSWILLIAFMVLLLEADEPLQTACRIAGMGEAPGAEREQRAAGKGAQRGPLHRAAQARRGKACGQQPGQCPGAESE